MRLGWTRRRRERARVAADLYAQIVAQARRPAFYLWFGVPDTVDGRFEMIVLHAFTVIRVLKGEGDDAERMAQALFDRMVADMDRSLREMGVGDLGVGKRVKKMVSAFFGRSVAYETGLGSGDASLSEALRRNVYGTVTANEKDIAALAAYVRGQAARIEGQAARDVLNGAVAFAAPPRDDAAGAK